MQYHFVPCSAINCYSLLFALIHFYFLSLGHYFISVVTSARKISLSETASTLSTLVLNFFPKRPEEPIFIGPIQSLLKSY
jgi:hypothetical protein